VSPPSRSFTQERDAALKLSLAKGVNPRRVQILVDEKRSALGALKASSFRDDTIQAVGAEAMSAVRDARALDTDALWRRAEAVGAGAVSRLEPEYPALLAPEYGPPPVLWVRPWPGGLAALGDRLAVAIVGTRKATPYGRRMARAIAADLASRGVVVVSGLAYGIDREAHEGALEAGGETVAVLGSGVDRVYPHLHARLAARILERGALLSEFPPGTPPLPGRFPQRNRVIAGMSRGTVIVESHERGGALITARMAGDMGRDIFCVPGPLDSPASRGVHALFRDGAAHLMTAPGDVAAQLGLGPAPRAEAPPSLTGDERAVLGAVTADPVHLDRLTDATGLGISTVLASLLTLELKGMVRQLAGRHFCRSAVGTG
jgi:DNA processing protein